ncbi:hypothetical protein GCM10010517_51820 [Streptosporangium fragile]|uniref:Uncharacterized protein n=1 Tax=Streptosporangium fragile TaxID=46186 RepID=A0ABP6ILD3_9ACTN
MPVTFTVYVDPYGDIPFDHVVFAYRHDDGVEAWHFDPDSPEPLDSFEHHCVSTQYDEGTWGKEVRPVDPALLPDLDVRAVWEEDGRLLVLQHPPHNYLHPVTYYIGVSTPFEQLAEELAPQIRRAFGPRVDPAKWLWDFINGELAVYGEWPALASWRSPFEPDKPLGYLVTETAEDVIRRYFDPGWEQALEEEYHIYSTF